MLLTTSGSSKPWMQCFQLEATFCILISLTTFWGFWLKVNHHMIWRIKRYLIIWLSENVFWCSKWHLCYKWSMLFSFPGFDDGKEDKQLRTYAVRSYLALLEEENVFYPQKFLQVMSWVRWTHGQNWKRSCEFSSSIDLPACWKLFHLYQLGRLWLLNAVLALLVTALVLVVLLF